MSQNQPGRKAPSKANKPRARQAPAASQRGRASGPGQKPRWQPKPASPTPAAQQQKEVKPADSPPTPPKAPEAGDVAVGEPISLTVPFALGKAPKALREQWPNVAFTVLPNAMPHSHPHLAITRLLGYRLALILAIQEARARHEEKDEDDAPYLLDVGGRLSYAAEQNKAHPKHKVHCSQPKLSNEDYMRVDRPDVPQCSHTFQECNCCPKAVMLFNHSLYYIPPDELIAGMNKRKVNGRAVAIALVHTWPDVAGRVAEASYERIEEDTVRMTVPGGRTYVNSAMNWLTTTPNNRIVSDHGVLMWDLMRHIGSPTQPLAGVYKFVLLRPDRELPAIEELLPQPEWEEADNWKDAYAGPMKGPTTLQLGDEVVQTERTIAVGRTVIFRFAGRRHYTVPKKLLYDAVLSMIGKSKSPDEFKSLINRIKAQLDQTDYPATYKASITPVVAALAMTRSAEMDRVAADHIQAERDNMDEHVDAAAAAFEARPWWRRQLDHVCSLPGDSLAWITTVLNHVDKGRTSQTVAPTIALLRKHWWLPLAILCAWRASRSPSLQKVVALLRPGVTQLELLGQWGASLGMTPLQRLLLVNGIIAPLQEESMKSWLVAASGGSRAAVGPAFGLAEWSARQFNSNGGPACLMHALTGRFTFWPALLIHSMFNTAVTLAQGEKTPGVAPVTVLLAAAAAAAICGHAHSTTSRVVLPSQSVPEHRIESPPAIITTANTSKAPTATTAVLRVRRHIPPGAAGKPYAQALGLVVLPAPAVVASTQYSERVSVTSRAFPDIFPEVSLETREEYDHFLNTHLVELFGPSVHLRPVSRAAFLAHYPAAQQRQYQQAYKELEHGADPFSKYNLLIDLFIKLEALVGKVVVEDYASELTSCPDPASQRDATTPAIDVNPRMISARKGVFQVSVGPTIVALQAHLCSLMNHASHVFITASTTSHKVGGWLEWAHNEGYVGWDEDKTKFDASTKGWKHYLLINALEEHFHLPSHVCDLLRSTLDWKRGRSPHGVEFTSEGGETNSGDFTTFINNSLHNYVDKAFVLWKMSGLIPALMAHRAIIEARQEALLLEEDRYFSVDTRRPQCVSDSTIAHPRNRPAILHMLAGDDAATLVDPKQWKQATGHKPTSALIPRIVTAYDGLGQIVVCNWLKHILDLDYCSGMIWPMRDHWLFGPTPGRLLTKMPWVKVDTRALMDRRGRHQTGLTLLRGNALGVWPICQHLPILREYVMHILRQTAHIKASPVILFKTSSYFSDVIPSGMAPGFERFTGYHVNTLSALYDRYGWTPDTLVAWRDFLSRHPLSSVSSTFARFAPLDSVFARDCKA